ncbi:uncharacterized protein LOC106656066 isoform X2 [Trichogramma pretiosum]|uniref:uncharacterized protein LOC106656066 isoform X2 n=1 Tax=Trichogramma pretiosum TaxID=7493 RepID=UPI000C71AF2C|nr:uncharacterized protein LOC106656066 isoform X2 [Trichogramma pretiosum]
MRDTANENGTIPNKECSSSHPSQDEANNSSTPSYLSDFHLRSTEIGEISEMPDYENLSTSAVLHYCKNKILKPYLGLLAVMGLRPNSEQLERCSLYSILANFHTCQVVLFMCMGYVLQYMACYRRDRGFCYISTVLSEISIPNKPRTYERTCHGNAIFAYFLPNALHLIAYIYAIYLFRVKENEQLQNLMERAFLLSSHPAHRGGQKHLVRILWLFIILGVIWIICASITISLMTANEIVTFQWLKNSSQDLETILKVCLILCTLWHDMVQGTIITSYCLQGQLLISHLHFLRLKLIQHTMPGLEWMKEVSEFKKLLKYFNDEFGPPVCIYTVVNISWTLTGTAWLLKYDSENAKMNPITCINIINVILWAWISVVPFIQAARLTTACSMIQNTGHEVRVRPFVHQSTPREDLDTLLMYTSSLKICARLFRVPITEFQFGALHASSNSTYANYPRIATLHTRSIETRSAHDRPNESLGLFARCQQKRLSGLLACRRPSLRSLSSGVQCPRRVRSPCRRR